MLTFTTGLCTLPRAVYYIVGQMAGAVAGGWFLKLGLQDHYYPGVSVLYLYQLEEFPKPETY